MALLPIESRQPAVTRTYEGLTAAAAQHAG
jgi:hypothetical protein